jgi:hypothetical protein
MPSFSSELVAAAQWSRALECMQHPSGYEATLDPWLERLFPALVATGALHFTPAANPITQATAPMPAAPAPPGAARRLLVSISAQSGPGPSSGGPCGHEAAIGDTASRQRLFQDACQAAAAMRRLRAAVTGAPPLDTGAPSAAEGDGRAWPAGEVSSASRASMERPCWVILAQSQRQTTLDHWQVNSTAAQSAKYAAC